jgi:hypothetical protein
MIHEEMIMRYFPIAFGVPLSSASISYADPVGTVADKVIVQELAKCVNGVAGCIGPNGEIVKALRNISNDLTRGPGDGNEITGKNGWVRRTFRW